MGLVIGRKPGESVFVEHLGAQLEVKVIKSKEGHLRLNLIGDDSFTFVRSELLNGNDSEESE